MTFNEIISLSPGEKTKQATYSYWTLSKQGLSSELGLLQSVQSHLLLFKAEVIKLILQSPQGVEKVKYLDFGAYEA